MTSSLLNTVAFDIDGTLLDPDHALRPAVRAAVQALHASGIAIVLASGRYLPSLQFIFDQLGIAEASLIGCSGGTALRVREGRPPEVLFASTLDRALAQDLAREALAAQMHVAWYDAEHWYAPSAEGWYAEETAILGHAPVVEPDFSRIAGEPQKVQLVAPDKAGVQFLRDLQARLQKEAAGRCRAVFSHVDMLEIVPPGVDKASGLRRLGEVTGLRLEDVLAFGDAENDMEMLAEVGFGVAMGNGTEALKATADWVTRSNAEEGVAYALAQPWLKERLRR